jgi:hypothetical protein
MNDAPSFETAAAAVAKLDARFGGDSGRSARVTVDQASRLAELRLLATADPAAVVAVIVRVCRRWVRRPTPDELGQLLRDELHRPATRAA